MPPDPGGTEPPPTVSDRRSRRVDSYDRRAYASDMSDDATTRVPFVTEREAVAAAGRDHYDHIQETRGYVGGPYPPLLNSPEVAGRIARLGTYVRYEGVLPGADRELAIISTARAFDAAFEWAAHAPIAREEGVREAAIETVATRGPLSDLTDGEAVVVGFVRGLLDDHEVDEATFRAAKDRFGVRGVTELVATIGYYSLIACVLNAFEVTPGADAPTLP